MSSTPQALVDDAHAGEQDPDLVTPEVMAEELTVMPTTILKWATAGLIPVVRITNKVVRFDRRRVLRELANKK